MKLYLNITSGQLVTSTSDNTSIGDLAIHQGDTGTVELAILQETGNVASPLEVIDLPAAYAFIRLGARLASALDSEDLLFAATEWTASGSGSTKRYTATLNRHTEGIAAAFSGATIRNVAALVDIEFASAEDEDRETPLKQWPATVSRDIYGTEEGIPSLANPWDEAKANALILALNTYATSTLGNALLPAGHLVDVADEAGRLALIYPDDVVIGDSVRQTDTGNIFMLADPSQISGNDGWINVDSANSGSLALSTAQAAEAAAGTAYTDAQTALNNAANAQMTANDAQSTADTALAEGTAIRAITYGGTGAANANDARTNLGAVAGVWTAAQIGLQAAVKSADTSRTSTTTLANDSELTMTLAAGTYHIEARAIKTSSNATPGFKAKLNFTGATTINSGLASGGGHGTTAAYLGNYPNTTDSSIFSPTLNFLNADSSISFVGLLVVTVGGTLSIQWAQAVSDATATVLKKGSYIKAQKLA